jgi:hypothetical protein
MNPVTGDKGRGSRGGCTLQASQAGSGLGSRVVCRCGLLSIEGFSICARFDPDRRRQPTALTAADRRTREFLFKVSDPLSPSLGVSYASDCGVALHAGSLQSHWQPWLFNTTRSQPSGRFLSQLGCERASRQS